MTVLNQQFANQTIFNAAFTSRTAAQDVSGGKQFNNYVATTRADVASAATITALSSSTSFVKITGSTETLIQGVTAGINGQHLTIYNGTDEDVFLVHESGSATAANRIDLPNDTDVTILAGASAELIYDTGQSRWVQKSGSGSGGGSTRTVGSFTGTSVTPDPELHDQTFLYTGGSQQAFDATGFGTLTDLLDGYRVRLMGSDDTNTITISESDISDGRLMPGISSIELGKGQYVDFEYNATLARMVLVGRSH